MDKKVEEAAVVMVKEVEVAIVMEVEVEAVTVKEVEVRVMVVVFVSDNLSVNPTNHSFPKIKSDSP